MSNFFNILAAFFLVALISSCKSCNSDTPDVSEIDVKLNVLRLEKDMPKLNVNYDSTYHALEERYGDFLPFFLKMVARVISPTDTAIQRDTFLHYVNDPYIKALRDTASVYYADISDIEKDLTKSFQFFRHYYPDAPLPIVVTYVDGPPYGFTYDIFYLAIGLDGYFGPASIFYSAQPDPIPEYIIRKFRREYIVPNTINVWLSGLYNYDLNSGKLLDAMVHKGKVYYAMKKLLPETHDTLIFGYPDSTLTWLDRNETEVWRFFIKNSLLYNSDPLVFSKYVNDAPNTSGMPPEAPGNIGSWIGYRIVKQYMERNEKITLPQLMSETDAQKILTDSRYKP